MKHRCHCFRSVSIFILLCNLSRMLFPRSYMTGNSFGCLSVSLRQVFTNVGSEAQGSELKDRFRIFPIMMETDVSRKQQELRDFSVKVLQMRFCKSSCSYINSRVCLFFSYFYFSLYFISAS